MKTNNLLQRSCLLLAALLSMTAAIAQSDVTQPGDPIIASSSNSPGSEGVANAIDGKPTKYLNFDTRTDGKPSGFIVSPGVGVTRVTGISFQSANDAPERDPKVVTIEGSNDAAITAFSTGIWEPIATLDNIPAFATRFETQSFNFTNAKGYRHYRVMVLETQTVNGCCFQVAEVELLGNVLPPDVTQPTDTIVASSSNSPGSEGVANAIDGQPTKYLNFDTRTDGKASGFVVTPSVGVTRVTGLSMQSANDAPERDPKIVTLEGSNDPTAAFDTGNWELITKLDAIPAYPGRFQTQIFTFANAKPYKNYRFTVLETQTVNGCCFQIAEVELLGNVLQDVTQPGDPVVASSSNSPGSEGVANAIDGKPTKYLNFDTRTGGKPSGFIVSPSIGSTVVSGIGLQSANDAPERDPKVVTIEGSNDAAVTAFDAGNWELIKKIDNIAAFPNRFQSQTLLFDNFKIYRHYRITVLETQTENGCCFQIAEVELFGGAPQDVTQPGDPTIASSSNSPGSEGVANIIDGKPTKYLNFDTRTGGKPSGFVVSPSVGASTIIGATMQSANDAPERDPKVVTIEGSNDSQITAFDSGTWTQIAKIENIPAFANRFQTQTFSFQNTVSYKHYRFTVLETQTENGCCFQMAEVELLALIDKAPSTAKFLVEPVNTPVLDGASATFNVKVDGPWTVQWHLNGQPIPGARGLTYTTPAITAVNTTNVYSAEIVGVRKSGEARAVLFAPSTTKSIGINFVGSGANGAPTSIDPTDIAGVHPQAYWMNVTTTTGDLPDDVVTDVKDSSNATSAISVHYESGGSWGTGTGTDNADRKILNGYLDGGDKLVTFGSVPAGKHSVIAYIINRPLLFTSGSYSVQGATTSPTIYVRAQNADEYNASPGYVRGTSTSAANPTVANFVRFDNVSPDASGTITLNGTPIPLNAVQLLINPVVVDPPQITGEPASMNAILGSSSTFTVTATGAGLSYEWRKNGVKLTDGARISGATTATLTISDVVDADAGSYSVSVSNAGGSIASSSVVVSTYNGKITDRLVAHWKFDETSGQVAKNAAAGGQDGQLKNYTGNAQWSAGKIGGALSFDGASQFVVVPNYTKPSTALAVSAWVLSSVANDTATIIANSGAIPAGAGIRLSQFELSLFGTEGDLRGAVTAGPNTYTSRAGAASPLSADQWHHIVLTADGARVTLYRNGNVVGSVDYAGKITDATAQCIGIGGLLDNTLDPNDPSDTLCEKLIEATPGLWTGKLDDIALWTRTLDAEEVQAIYEAGQGGKDVEQVVGEQPPPVMSVSTGATGITIAWTASSGFRLQVASSVTGPYADVAGVTGTSITVANTGDTRFFRMVK